MLIWEVLCKPPHNHGQVLDEIEKKDKINEMKAPMRIINGTVRSIVSTVPRAASGPTLQNVGNLQNPYRILREYRNSIINPSPYLFSELQLC